MIGLLEPLALAALASLLLPVAIHLVRRADLRPLAFAAMRFLNDRPHPRREWQLRRWPLLALRLLLLGAVSLLLAGPVWRARHDAHGSESTVTAAADGAPAATLRAAFATASQLRQLDAELPRATQLTVVVPEQLGGLDAERLHLRHPLRWEIVPGPSPPAGPPPAITPSPLPIAVRVDAMGSAELPVAKALLSAWNASGAQAVIDTAPQTVPIPAQTAWLLWLGGPLSPQARTWVRSGGRVLLTRDPAWRGAAVLTDARGSVLFRERPLGLGRILSTTAELSVTALPGLRDATIAERLQSLLSAPLAAPDRAYAADVAPSPMDEQSVAGVQLIEQAAALAALLFLVERLWATRTP